MAAGGSFGQGRPAGGAGRGGFSAQGAAASGSIGGGQPSGGLGGGGTAGGGQVDREALAQRQNERFGRLGPPDAGRQEQRQEQRAAAREDHQAYATNRREDWQDYADDHYDEHGYYPGTAAAVAAGAAVGAAAGAAVATPPYWTLSCTPTTVVVGGTTYYQCGSAWYIRAYSGGEVSYSMVNPPAGY